MTEQTLPEIGNTLGGRYQLSEKIGEGGFGKIYRAQQINIERDVAIKVLPPQFSAMPDVVKRFRREARLASRLRHPNTITIHDYGQEENLFYIAMEYLRGEDLADRLARVRTLSLSMALHIGRQTLHSLKEAHQFGIVHRDLKPENIFLTHLGDDENFVKVLDFGIAQLATSSSESNTDDDGRRLTIQGNTVGTPAYMSPEQATGETVDASSDLYTLGIILYEMLNGRPPFLEERPVRTMRAHLFDPIPSFTNQDLAGTTFESIVRKALTKDRDNRFTSAAEFLDALAQPNLDSKAIGFTRLGEESNHASRPPSSDEFSLGTGTYDTPAHAQSTARYKSAAAMEKKESKDQVPFGALQQRRQSPPPKGFSTSQGSATSSILTVLKPSEEEVIVLTDKKQPEKPEKQEVSTGEETAISDSRSNHSDWKWSDDVAATDASGSQILTDFDGTSHPRRFILIAAALTITVVVFLVIITTGWQP